MTPQKDDFTPIRVSTLRGDLKIPFDAYVQVAGKQILYCRRGDSFEGSRLERLKSKKLKKLFIRSEDEDPYQKYLEQNIDEAYDNSAKKPLELRAEVIQGFQQAAAEQCMEDPMDEVAYKYVRNSITRFIGFLETEPKGAGALLSLENSDHSVSHHSVNVATIATSMVLHELQGESTMLQLLSLGCLLHDIEHFHGSFDVVRPPAELKGEELKTYHAHPIAGAARFQQAIFVDQMVVKIIAQHEEFIDGTGFPRKLRGKDIDPIVLIAGTANAYDRMISFEEKKPKDALKALLIEKMGCFPLEQLKTLQTVLKIQSLV